jgi:hypothetical protein
MPSILDRAFRGSCNLQVLKAMNKVDAATVRGILDRHQASGFHVDDRLRREVDQPGEIFLDILATREEFLRLVWQSSDATRPLTPVGEPRTLLDCAGRLSTFGWEFQPLIQAGFEWFRPCVDIDKAFDYGNIGLVALTPLIESERRETPVGNYYIYDGVHKSIVLAKRLLRGEAD